MRFLITKKIKGIGALVLTFSVMFAVMALAEQSDAAMVASTKRLEMASLHSLLKNVK